MKNIPAELYFSLQSSLIMTEIIELLPETDLCLLLKQTLSRQNSALIAVADEKKLDQVIVSEWILDMEKVSWQIEELKNVH